MQTLKVIHLSDLHFSHINRHFSQFLSKAWIGNTNLLLFRKKALEKGHFWKLIELFKKMGCDAVIITGDLATTSQDAEFLYAKSFVKALSEHFPVYLIPGNHDVYTKKADLDKTFYSYFPSSSTQSPNLEEDRVEVKSLNHGWWWIGLDTALATPIFFSHGEFFDHMQKTLENALEKIPPEDSIILCNHFPLFSTQRPRHDLKNKEILQKIVKNHPNIKIYLHGHDHHSYIIDRQSEGFPLSINAGSSSVMHDQAAFNVLEITPTHCHVHIYCYQSEQWTLKEEKSFLFKPQVKISLA